jgi:flagellin-like hook-associated protein FlgL
MVKVGSNILAQIIQRNLGRHSGELQQVYQRLASGSRINRPSDDPAGHALASSLNLQGRIANQRLRGLNDAISLTSIATQALDALTQVIERMQELSTSASNSTLTTLQRAAIDREAQALASEYNRIARTTTWNGSPIFDASFGTINLSTGDQGSSAGNLSSTLGGFIGTGTLNADVSYAAGVAESEAQIADFNGDGIPDIAATSAAGQINMLLGNGDGTFRSGAAFSAITAFFMKAGDVNGDSKVDLVLSNYFPSGGLYTYLGNGDGTFTFKGVSATSGSMQGLQLYDLTGDGVLDVSSVSDGGGTTEVNILKGNGDGTFTLSQTLAAPGSPFDLQVGDFTGDAYADIIASGFSPGSYKLYVNRGDGSFSSATDIAGIANNEIKATGDFNQDGNLDFIATNQNQARLALYLGQGNGTFQNPLYIPTASVPYSARVLDINGDGRLDLAATTLTNSYLQIILGNGDGTFQSAQTYSASGSPRILDVGDLNGDGVPDVVVPKYNSGTIGVFIAETTAGVSALQPLSLKTVAEARKTVTTLAKRHELLMMQKAHVRAFQERLESAVSQQDILRDGLQQAADRILDTDVARDAATMLRIQVLHEFVVALLAQANQDPSLVTALLERPE